MDEFLVAIMSAIAIVSYTIITFFLFDFEYKTYVRWGLLIFVVLWILIYFWKRRNERRSLKRLGVDAENYVYYQKFTSPGNKFSYVFTYMIQDFIYEVKKRNKAYNFSKGMFRFDDSLGEYYIDCRIGWYAYFRINILKNRLSLHKLRIFSLGKCNQLLLNVFPEQEEIYKQVKKDFQRNTDECLEGKKLGYSHLYQFEESKKLHPRIWVNLFEMEVSRKFMKDNVDAYHEYLKKQEKRKDDIREIKNLYIELDKKN